MSAAFQLESLPGSIGLLTFDDPGMKVNTFSRRTWADLDVALNTIKRESYQGLILTSGKPGQFSAGADLRELYSLMGQPSEQITEAFDIGRKVLANLSHLPIPVVAAVEGACLGGGLELALACDVIMAADTPKTFMGLPETRLSLIPGWGGTQRLPRQIGLRSASEMIVSGLTISAAQARSIGMVVSLCEPERLIDEAKDFVMHLRARGEWNRRRAEWESMPTANSSDRTFLAELASKPHASPQAVACVVDVIERGWLSSLAEGLAIEAKQFTALMKSEPAKAAVAAFLEKSRPRPS